MSRLKRKILTLKTSKKQAALKHDLHKGDDIHLHNHQGGGALPTPSQLGWGVRKADRKRISLFDPFRGGR
jgi:hypothetical protein